MVRTGSIEAIADDVQHGKVTDFYRAVKAEDGETVVFSLHRMARQGDSRRRVGKIMADESMKPEGDMPFTGQRMFWGGFEPILDTADKDARKRLTPIKDCNQGDRTMTDVRD